MTFDEWLDRELLVANFDSDYLNLVKLVRAYRKLTKGWVTKEILTLEKSLIGEDQQTMKIPEHECPQCGRATAGDNPKMLCYDCANKGKDKADDR